MNWHLQPIDTSLEALQSNLKTGLSQAEADSRLTKYGRNELVEKSGRTPLKIFWEQITATMVLILIAAAVVAGLLGDTKNTIDVTNQDRHRICELGFDRFIRSIKLL